jgi:DNA-binding NarL/FixJ family response regulator
MSKAIAPELNADDKTLMEKLLRSGHIEHKYAVRPQTVLHRANGKSSAEIAKCLGININSVTAYVKKYNILKILENDR